MTRALALLLALFLASAPALARGHGGGGHGTRSPSSHSTRSPTHSGSHRTHSTGGSHSTRSHGTSRLKRDPAQRRAFERTHSCPSTGRTSGACPGYVVDHVMPLKRGGADRPSNMQWQTVEAAKAKDRVE